MEISQGSWADIEYSLNLDDLVKACREEGGAEGLPEGKLSHEIYRSLEANGNLFVIKALDDGTLMGAIIILLYISPHYSVKLAQVDLVFLDKKYRNTRAGLEMLKQAEDVSKRNGAIGISFNAHIHTALEELLNIKKYKLTHRIYFKPFNDTTTSTE